MAVSLSLKRKQEENQQDQPKKYTKKQKAQAFWTAWHGPKEPNSAANETKSQPDETDDTEVEPHAPKADPTLPSSAKTKTTISDDSSSFEFSGQSNSETDKVEALMTMQPTSPTLIRPTHNE